MDNGEVIEVAAAETLAVDPRREEHNLGAMGAGLMINFHRFALDF